MTIAEGLANSLFEIYLSKTPATEFGSSALVGGSESAGNSNAAQSATLVLLKKGKSWLPEICKKDIDDGKSKERTPD